MIPAPPERRAAWLPAWVWAVAAAALLLALYAAFETRRLVEELRVLHGHVQSQELDRAKLEADRQTYQRALTILSATDTRVVNLKPSGKSELPEVHAYWNARLGLVLTAARIQLPAADRALQLWVVPKKGAAVSAGVFRPDGSGGVFLVASPQIEIGAAAALEITNEPNGGSVQPTSKPIWAGPIH